MAKKNENTTKMSFEEALNQLETIVKKLENGSISLDDSIQLYEEGIKLVDFCNQSIEKAEQKIALVSKDAEGNYTVTEKEDEE